MYTACMTYDNEIRIVHGGEDTDFALVGDNLLATVIQIPSSEEWEGTAYDAALLDAGWRRTGQWSSFDAAGEAPVEPVTR